MENYRVIYAKKDVTADFRPLLKRLSYSDSIEGKASSVELELRDKEGIFRGAWFPEVADVLEVEIGALKCGTYYVDDISLRGSRAGDICTIGALSLEGAALVAEKKRKSFAGIAVDTLAAQTAQRLSLKYKGKASGTWSGTQQDETDLQLLVRVARETGHILKIEDGVLLVYRRSYLAEIEPQFTVSRTDCKDYNIKDIAAGRISSVTCKWWDAEKKQTYSGTYNSGIAGGGNIEIRQQCGSDADAKEKAEKYYQERKKKGVEIDLTLAGDSRIRAGVTLELRDFGRFDGVYLVSEAKHTLVGGYSTTAKLTK